MINVSLALASITWPNYAKHIKISTFICSSGTDREDSINTPKL